MIYNLIFVGLLSALWCAGGISSYSEEHDLIKQEKIANSLITYDNSPNKAVYYPTNESPYCLYKGYFGVNNEYGTNVNPFYNSSFQIKITKSMTMSIEFVIRNGMTTLFDSNDAWDENISFNIESVFTSYNADESSGDLILDFHYFALNNDGNDTIEINLHNDFDTRYYLHTNNNLSYCESNSSDNYYIAYIPFEEIKASLGITESEIYDWGYGEGYNEGYGYGEYDGYNAGIAYATEQGTTATIIFTGIIDIALVPINFFLACLNFEVFGINIGAAVSATLTVCIIIILFRIIVGSGVKGGGDNA